MEMELEAKMSTVTTAMGVVVQRPSNEEEVDRVCIQCTHSSLYDDKDMCGQCILLKMVSDGHYASR